MENQKNSEESIEPWSTTDNGFHPEIIYNYGKIIESVFKIR